MSRCSRVSQSSSIKQKQFIELDNVSIDALIEHEKLLREAAQNVFDCTIQAQSKICTIHGPFSEQERKESYPHVYSRDLGNDFYIDKKEVLHINPGEDGISLIFSGLQENTIIIHGKVNHVFIRKCENVRLDIKEGTVSGVDILYCKHMFVIMPYHNFTNLEYGEGIYFQAEINEISQLHFTGSLDVKVNGISLPINPFMNAMFGKDGWCYKKQSEIPKLMIWRY